MYAQQLPARRGVRTRAATRKHRLAALISFSPAKPNAGLLLRVLHPLPRLNAHAVPGPFLDGARYGGGNVPGTALRPARPADTANSWRRVCRTVIGVRSVMISGGVARHLTGLSVNAYTVRLHCVDRVPQ